MRNWRETGEHGNDQERKYAVSDHESCTAISVPNSPPIRPLAQIPEPPRLCWYSSLQPLVQLADPTRQLTYVALVTLDVGFDITDDDVEAELDVCGRPLRRVVCQIHGILARLVRRTSEATVKTATHFHDVMPAFHLL